MVKKSKKSKSKRTTLKQKYKVEKKVRQAHRAQRRAAKKGGHRMKKDPGIPADYPMREKFIKQMQKSHEALVAHEKQQRRTVVQMAAQAQVRSAEYKVDAVARSKIKVVGADNKLADASRHAYYSEFKEVVEESDVILQVLDARDPLGCRCRSVEQAILEKGDKKLVLVLNKVDLIPKNLVEEWLKYLRHELPTVAFKCSTQNQKHNLQGESLGTNTLLQLLKNYSRSLDLKKSITVGIVGYPNVGKSSLINTLKRQRVVQTGARPGVTKQQSQIRLDKHIVLLDCPGIVFDATEVATTDAILRNAVEVEKLDDPVGVIEAVLRRVPVERMATLYQIAAYRQPEEFLSSVARRMGKLKKGGVPDFRAAAVAVLKDWASGKIKYHSQPPQRRNETVVVSHLAQEFDMSAIEQQERTDLMELSDDEVEEDEVVHERLVMDEQPQPRKKQVRMREEQEEEEDEQDELNPQANRAFRKAQRKAKKKRVSSSRPYSFAADFVPAQEMEVIDEDDDDEGEEIFDI